MQVIMVIQLLHTVMQLTYGTNDLAIDGKEWITLQTDSRKKVILLSFPDLLSTVILQLHKDDVLNEN
jgi:hypothetical protein